MLGNLVTTNFEKYFALENSVYMFKKSMVWRYLKNVHEKKFIIRNASARKNWLVECGFEKTYFWNNLKENYLKAMLYKFIWE